VDSNKRKDASLSNRGNFKNGGITIVGSSTRGIRNLSYAESMKRRKE